MSKKAAPEGFQLKNPHFNPDGTKRPPNVPEQIVTKREKVEIVNPCVAKPGFSKTKTLERLTFASGVIKSRLFPGIEQARIQKGGQIGTTVTEIALAFKQGASRP